MAKYGNNYKKSITPSGPPNTFTALLTIPGKPSVRYPHCKIWNGVLVRLISVGQGKKIEKGGMNAYGEGETWEEWDYYAYIPVPLFCNAKFRSEEERQTVLKLSQECDKKQEHGPLFEQYRHAMFVMGDNGHGYAVEDEQKKHDTALQSGSKPIDVVTGLFGLKILDRLPSDLWGHVKPHARYVSYEEADDYQEDCIGYERYSVREIMGWHYTPDAITELLAVGCSVAYRGQPLTDVQEMTAIDNRLSEEERVREENAQARQRRGTELEKTYRSLVQFELMNEADTESVLALPKITSKLLRREGAHLYGVGHWLKRDNHYLYEVSQNGHDGDDWSRNNSREGIVWRTPLTDELKQVLSEIEQFDN